MDSLVNEIVGVCKHIFLFVINVFLKIFNQFVVVVVFVGGGVGCV